MLLILSGMVLPVVAAVGFLYLGSDLARPKDRLVDAVERVACGVREVLGVLFVVLVAVGSVILIALGLRQLNG